MGTELLSHTGALAAGFGVNLAMTLLAMILGTAVGAALGLARFGGGKAAVLAHTAGRACRNPFVLAGLFACVIVVPLKLEWNGMQYPFPLWIKVAVALGIPVTGFVSDRMLSVRRQIADRAIGVDQVFFAAWLRLAAVLLLVSPLASIIGVNEALGRAHAVAATGSSAALAAVIYLETALWFVAAVVLTGALAGWIEQRSAEPRDRIVNYHTRRRRPDFEVRDLADPSDPVRKDG